MFSSIPNAYASAPLSSQEAGRFAFPAGSSLTPEQKLRTLDQLSRAKQTLESQKTREEIDTALSAEQKRLAMEQAWQKHLELEEQRRRVRQEREREQALIGEKHWVRQGGILRDADGRRDYKRTEEIRKIVEREDAERQIIERWSAYESAWMNIISSKEKPVTFADMPWPLASPPKGPEEIRNPASIADFLFESLSIAQNTTTRRERLRTSLLRWHPDKLGSVLARVPESDLGAVKDGIDAVVIGLMKLQEAEKAR